MEGKNAARRQQPRSTGGCSSAASAASPRSGPWRSHARRGGVAGELGFSARRSRRRRKRPLSRPPRPACSRPASSAWPRGSERDGSPRRRTCKCERPSPGPDNSRGRDARGPERKRRGGPAATAEPGIGWPFRLGLAHRGPRSSGNSVSPERSFTGSSTPAFARGRYANFSHTRCCACKLCAKKATIVANDASFHMLCFGEHKLISTFSRKRAILP